MQMSIEEFESHFFDPKRVEKYLEKRQAWIDQYTVMKAETRWTTYLMMLGILASSGRLSQTEYQQLGPIPYSQGKEVPSPERLYTLTALVDLLQ